METQQLLQQVLNSTLERMARQTFTYESEIANLNAQILLHKEEIEKLSNSDLDSL